MEDDEPEPFGYKTIIGPWPGWPEAVVLLLVLGTIYIGFSI